MGQRLQVLVVEDSDEDAELMIGALRADGFEVGVNRAMDERSFMAGLDWGPDLILCDYSMPRFSAPRALELLRRSGRDTPLLIVTGSIGEEVAVECMKQGAADYLLKDRLGRLGSAATQALHARGLREENRRSARARETMIQELNHRVKNNLAVVLSLADQTRRTTASMEEFYNAFAARVKAMAGVHQLLSASSWRGVDMGDLVSRIMAPFVAEDSGRVEVRGEEAVLSALAAPVLAMVLHELATNAVKHGALSSATGRVLVSWETVAAGHDSPVVMTLRWEEQGGPAITAEPAQGFGLTMIRDALTHELGGRVELRFPADGVKYHALVPLGDEQVTSDGRRYKSFE